MPDALREIAEILDKDVDLPVFKNARRALSAYRLGKKTYTGCKKWVERQAEHVRDIEARDAQAKQYVITIHERDHIYQALYCWITDNTQIDDEHEIQIETFIVNDDDDDDDYNDSSQKGKDECQFVFGRHFAQEVTIGGHAVNVAIVRGKAFGDGDGDGGEQKQTIVFTNYMKMPDKIVITAPNAEARDAVRAFINKLLEEQAKIQRVRYDRQPSLYVARWGHWGGSGNLRLRPMSSVVLRKGQADELMADLEKFLGAEKEYVRRSIPWHRGFVFHGPPGTGKTSLAMGLASHFKLDLYYLSLGDIDKDEKLIDLVTSVDNIRDRSILLLEDVDVFSAATRRGQEKGTTSMSALLNTLDGVMTPHGLIVIMTTNNLEALDPALVRPGRVDRLEELTYVDEDQATRIFRNFYPDLSEDAAGRVGGACVGMVPAQILEVCKRHLETPQEAVAELTDPNLQPELRAATVVRMRDRAKAERVTPTATKKKISRRGVIIEADEG